MRPGPAADEAAPAAAAKMGSMWGNRKTQQQAPATGYAHLVRERVVVQTTTGKSIRGVIVGDYSNADRSPTIVLGHGHELRATSEGVQAFPVGSDLTIPLARIESVQIQQQEGGDA